MAKLIIPETKGLKTYKTHANAVKAFEAIFGDCDVRYLVLQNGEGRYFPAALGEKALQAGVHFHFHVLG